MIEEIRKEILSLERANNIKIVYAVESGSRAWGFASTNSDWDVRFIYVHHTDWYLSIEEKKDNIEYILPNDIDMAGWELKKALLLFKKSNPPLLEWLISPIIYTEQLTTASMLRQASAEYFNPKSCLYHYFNMGRRNHEAYFKGEEVRLKKYFYILRPLLACCWIERTGEMPPVEFDKLMQHEITEASLKKAIEQLLDIKKSGQELDKGERIPGIDEFLENKFRHFDQYLKDYHFKNEPSYDRLNGIFRETLKNAWE